MPAKAKPVPDGYHAVIPYLIVDGAAAAIEFYKQAFGARERLRLAGPGDKVGHTELEIGDSTIMLADEFPEMQAYGPKSVGGTPVKIHLYVPDVDATVERALAAGATLIAPVKDQFYGDRTGGISDPFGHVWYVATHVEDVPQDEIERRAAALYGGA